MKLLFDENLSPRLARIFEALFPGTTHVSDCGLDASSDDSIWRFARENGFSIVSKDSDFHDRGVLYGSPPKVIWIRVGNCSVAEIEQLLVRAQAAIETFEDGPDTTLVVRRQT